MVFVPKQSKTQMANKIIVNQMCPRRKVPRQKRKKAATKKSQHSIQERNNQSNDLTVKLNKQIFLFCIK